MKKTIFVLAAVCIAAADAAGQTLDPDYYVYPVLNVAGLYSANFGEMRPDHFHSGIDIKTDGVEGKPVVAAADGYISRIVDKPSGYGRALYVVHPNGTTSVYGHLSRFRSDIDSLVLAERYRTEHNSMDMFRREGELPVSQGEVIGYSGNTGNSFGPHLHFEIRDSRTQRTLNTIAQGVIKVRDTIPPIICGLHYVAVDTVGILPVRTAPRRIEVRRDGQGRYSAASTVRIAPKGYFILEVSDRKNDVHNRFGVYRASEHVDGEHVFEYRADGYTFDVSRYCNAVSCYPMQVAARCEVIRLSSLEGNRDELFYTVLKNRAVIEAASGEQRHIRIEAEDDCGNISIIEFDATGGAEPPTVDTTMLASAIDRNRPFTSDVEDMTVSIPAKSLYESVPFFGRKVNARSAVDSTVIVLSPVYEAMSRDIPLHKAATVSIRAYIPQDMRRHAALATFSAKGKAVFAGGEYGNGAVTARTARLGAFFVVADTVPPKITPKFALQSDMRGRKELIFTVADNFSGIKDYSATIDGRWVPIDYSPVRGTMSHKFDHLYYARGTKHVIKLMVTDNCGNTAIWQGEFTR